MFELDEKDLSVTLREMERESRIRSNFDQGAARQKMAQWLSQDRRFDGFDKNRLVERVTECRQSGGVLDLTDPTLRGGPPRVGDRRTG
jgi:hypothetical protein